MPHRDHNAFVLVALLAVASAAPVLPAHAFELADGGRTFVYRARPGEPPARVAASFGVPEDAVASFLAANGITDATRVPVGFEYRIPNPLGPRLDTLAAELDRLAQAATAQTARGDRLERALSRARARAAVGRENMDRLAALEAWWPALGAALGAALLGLAGACWFAWRAVRRLSAVERHAHDLEQESSERRRATLAQRQEAERRIITLEHRLRRFEHGPPRLVTTGRG